MPIVDQKAVANELTLHDGTITALVDRPQTDSSRAKQITESHRRHCRGNIIGAVKIFCLRLLA